MATREGLSDYSKQTRKIVRLAQRDLRKFFALLDLTQPEVARDALLDFLPQLTATYGDIAAVAAAEWYENLRGKVAGLPSYETVLSSGVKREAIVETVRWAAGGLWGDDPQQVRRVLDGCVQAWVKYSGRDTVARNVEFDPAKPRYARVPRGAHSCAWCAMLASRGFVYHTKETAGYVEGTFHNDCDCEIVPSFEAKSAHITGYDPDTLYAQYKAARAKVGSEGGDINDQHLIVAQMRKLFPTSFKKGPATEAVKKEISSHRVLRGPCFGTKLGWTERNGSPRAPLKERKSYEECFKRAAPREDTDKFYEYSHEREVADWLRSHGMTPLSVQRTQQGSYPDACLIDEKRTVEYKETKNSNFLTACDRLRKGAEQSGFVVYRCLASMNEQQALSIMKTALEESGQHLDRLVIIYGDGGDDYLEWVRS